MFAAAGQAPALAQFKPLPAAKRMVIADQDAAGPGGTDMMSLLVLLQDPKDEVLGITVVTGDGWESDEVQHTLRLLEITGHAGIPVVPGADQPLTRTREATYQWDSKFSPVQYKGVWTRPDSAPMVAGADPKEGRPTTKPANEDAAHFLVRMTREHPHQIAIYEGGPMTNLALAIKLDPEFPARTAGLVFMGGAVDPHSADSEISSAPHREFNLWFDPDAAAAVFRAQWPSITCTTVDVSIETRFTNAMLEEIGRSKAPAAQYIAKYPDQSYMWDELAAAAWLDPSLITRTIPIFMDVNTDPTSPHYGDTLVYRAGEPHDPSLQPVTAQMDVDVARFNRFFVGLMTASHTANTLRGVVPLVPSQR